MTTGVCDTAGDVITRIITQYANSCIPTLRNMSIITFHCVTTSAPSPQTLSGSGNETSPSQLHAIYRIVPVHSEGVGSEGKRETGGKDTKMTSAGGNRLSICKSPTIIANLLGPLGPSVE